MDYNLVDFVPFITWSFTLILKLKERKHLCSNECFHLKRWAKGAVFASASIWSTNFYKYSYLTISIRLINLFLYDFLNVSKYSFLKSFKNYNSITLLIEIAGNDYYRSGYFTLWYSLLLFKQLLRNNICMTMVFKLLNYYGLFAFTQFPPSFLLFDILILV